MERNKQDRHEYPSGTGYVPPSERGPRTASLVENAPLWGPHNVPDDEYEALMVCAPWEEPQQSQEELDVERDLQEMLLSELTPKERTVIELVVYGQMSLSQAGVMLGHECGRLPYSKAGVAKLRDSALAKLRAALS